MKPELNKYLEEGYREIEKKWPTYFTENVNITDKVMWEKNPDGLHEMPNKITLTINDEGMPDHIKMAILQLYRFHRVI